MHCCGAALHRVVADSCDPGMLEAASACNGDRQGSLLQSSISCSGFDFAEDCVVKKLQDSLWYLTYFTATM